MSRAKSIAVDGAFSESAVKPTTEESDKHAKVNKRKKQFIGDNRHRIVGKRSFDRKMDDRKMNTDESDLVEWFECRAVLGNQVVPAGIRDNSPPTQRWVVREYWITVPSGNAVKSLKIGSITTGAATVTTAATATLPAAAAFHQSSP